MAEPTILIKKADGTTERVPLSAVQKKKSDQNTDTPGKMHTDQRGDAKTEATLKTPAVKAAPVPTQKETVTPKKDEKKKTMLMPARDRGQRGNDTKTVATRTEKPAHKPAGKQGINAPANQSHTDTITQELSTTTPVDDIFVGMARAQHWKKDDHVSPLETPLAPGEIRHQTGHQLPQKRVADIESVVARLPFSLPADLKSRLHSLIESRIKEVRTDAQLRLYAMEAPERGGLGLRASEASDLLATIQASLQLHETDIPPAPRGTVQNTHRSPRVPQTPPVPLPQSVSRSAAPASPTRTLTDIHPPAPVPSGHVGPIEEIGELTIEDFRRYHQDPAQAVALLQQKVETLRNESYLEYAKGKGAWLQSPLYQTYLAQLAHALTKKQPLNAILSDGLTEGDMKELAAFSASLRM